MIPVYGFSQYYLDEKDIIYSKHTKKPLKPSKNGSSVQIRFRLCDKKYYDLKYLVYKSHFPMSDIEVNDKRILWKDGNACNNKIDNLYLANLKDRKDCSEYISKIYQERVLPVPNFNNYYISENGNLYSLVNIKPKILKPFIDTNGYSGYVLVNDNNIRVHKKVHRMVAENFVTNPSPLEFSIVHHRDENKLNNNYSNLEWCTSQYNNAYSFGKKCCMVDSYGTILSVHDTISDLAATYNVNSSTASKQCRGIKGQFTKKIKARFFNEADNTYEKTKFD